MRSITDILEMQRWSDERRMEGKTIAFVPTMGCFHNGHLRLMEEGKRRGGFLVVSIFVNPTQFGPGNDYHDYPRDLKRDRTMAEDVGVDLLFAPSIDKMYPEGFQSYVTVEEVTKNLCGLSRPNHFRGVATVVTKLFNIVKPHVALFGEKDYQQLITIRRMVRDLNFDIEIKSIPTVREEDGLAMSSRNSYLNEDERDEVRSLYASLKMGRELWLSGERDSMKIIEEVRRGIEKGINTEVDYIKICDPETLKDIDAIQDRALLALAVKIGKARLIDHCILR